MASAGVGLGEELSSAKGIQRLWEPEESEMAQTEKEVLACVPLGWKGSEVQLQPPNPAPHAHSPPALPSAELSPPAVRLYSLGILVPGQGGPGQLQRQEGPGLRPPQPARTPHQPPASPQAALPPCALLFAEHLHLCFFSGHLLRTFCLSALCSQGREMNMVLLILQSLQDTSSTFPKPQFPYL